MFETCLAFWEEVKDCYDHLEPCGQRVCRVTALLGGVLVGLSLKKTRHTVLLVSLLFMLCLGYSFYRLFVQDSCDCDDMDWDCWDDEDEDEASSDEDNEISF